MVNLVGADALMSTLYAKYHYLFWRPVRAIDPSDVTADGFGPVPDYEDGNSATIEQMGWLPLLTTPNHPEYPAAHGAITSAMAEALDSRSAPTARSLSQPSAMDCSTTSSASVRLRREFRKAVAARHAIG
jgi:hypothetical protein